MFHLIYKSQSEYFDQKKLDDLLIAARDKNKSRGITGMLLYKAGNIIQLIEHEERDIILNLFSAVANDTRHNRVHLIAMVETSSRLFPDWTMASKKVGDQESKLWDKINLVNDGSVVVKLGSDTESNMQKKLINLLLEFNFSNK